MRCAATILGWTIGLPLFVMLAITEILLALALCEATAQHLGLPKDSGGAIAALAVFAAIGAWIGISTCRGRAA